MKILKFILIIIFPLVTAQAYSQPKGYVLVKDKKAISLKLKKVSASTKTIDSDFIQYKHLDILENDIVSDGHFSFKTPNKVRWQYTKPYNYLIVMNSGQMWIKDDKKTQKFDTQSNKVFKEINDLMVGLLQGNILENTDFKTEFYSSKTRILAILIPQKDEMKEFLSEIHLYFDKTDFTVSELKMLENSGDFTLIKFLKKKTNVEILDSKFIVK